MRRLLLLVLCLAAPLAAQTVAPELPRGVPSTVMPTQSGAVHTIATGGDVQAAITEAEPGDVIEFPCSGQTYQGSYTLPNKGASSAWVVLRSACAAQVPEGTRMTPAKATALRLPRFIAPSGAPVFTTDYGAHHYRLVGLEIAGGYPGGSGNTLFSLGSDAQTTPAQIAHDLVLDRLYMHGAPTLSLRRCIALNSASTAIVDSWCADAHENGSDSQAILGWTGPGPYLIRNNHLEAGHEVIMFGGGGDPFIVGLVPSDITIQRNHITRPVAWKDVWQAKNLFELKSARRVLVEGNVLENNWPSGQDGNAVLFKSTNQGGACTWCGTQDVTFRFNIVRNGGYFNLAAHPDNPVVPLARVAITDNLITSSSTSPLGALRVGFQVQQDIADLAISRNTSVTDAASGTLVFMPFGTPPTVRFRYTYNLAAASPNYGLYGDNSGGGLVALALYAPDAVVTGNLFAGMTQRDNMADYLTLYPAGNRFLRTLGEVGFANAAAGDYARPGSDSAGVDLAALGVATAGVVTGAWPTPTPAPVPTITAAQLRAAVAALDKAISAAGRENAATKVALKPAADYLRALLATVP